MVSLLWHCGDPKGLRGQFKSDVWCEKIPLNTIRLCGMGVLPSKALDTSRSLHLIDSYLLKDGHRRL